MKGPGMNIMVYSILLSSTEGSKRLKRSLYHVHDLA